MIVRPGRQPGERLSARGSGAGHRRLDYGSPAAVLAGWSLVSGILVRFADQAKTSMILAGVSRRMAGWPGFTCGSAEDLHTVYIVPAKHLQRLAWNWT